ncbi:MAG: PEP-CTERM sorting domain-containing protein [Pirellulales bacterium]
MAGHNRFRPSPSHYGQVLGRPVTRILEIYSGACYLTAIRPSRRYHGINTRSRKGILAMKIKQSETLDRQLESYGVIAQRRTQSPAHAGPGGSANWRRFAAATGASLASAAVADAAINHVVPPVPIRVVADNNESHIIDLDGDSQFDLRIGAGKFSGPIGTNFWSGTARGLYDAVLVGDYLFGSTGYTNAAVRKFQNGAEIPAAQPSLTGTVLRASTTAFGSPYGHVGLWGLGESALAGIVGGINGQPRAGWIKIRTESLSGRLRAVSVLEWAIESVPGVSIMAGQTSSGSIPGDYNNNGSVGSEDYTVWKNTFNQNVTAGTGADGNNNGKVDAADYTVWRDHKNAAGSGALSGAVPEPSTVTLGVLALGAAGVVALRRRSK